MIITSLTHWCPNCHSTNIVKNGHTRHSNQRCLCHDCGKTRVLIPRRDKELDPFMEKALRERLSLRGMARIFGVSLQTGLLLLQRLARSLPALRHSLMPAQADDSLELDELYSFVESKKHKRWLWVALCRRTRQVGAFVIGDRSEKSCRKLFGRLPAGYRGCASYSDFWWAYAKVFQTGRHQSVDKATGERAHVERWNCTLRQRAGRYVRKTLSLSKTERYHHLATKYFIWHYTSIASSTPSDHHLKEELDAAVHQAVETALVSHLPHAIQRATAKPYLTKRELMELTGWSARQVEYKKSKREIPFIRRGRLVLFPTEEIYAYLDQGYVPPRSSTNKNAR